MARIVVVGSIGLDEVVHLRTPLRVDAHLEGRRIPPRLGGGGANTAYPLAVAGHAVRIVSATGDDTASGGVLAELRAAGVDTSAVARIPGGPTHALILVDPSGERTVVNLHRPREDGPPERLLDLAADAVFVRARSPALAPLLARLVADRLVVAHVPPDEPGARPAHVLVASETDVGEAFLHDPWSAGRRIAGDTLRWVIVTRGAAGAAAWSESETLSVPAPQVRSRDRTGAGDAFAAGLLHGLVRDLPMPAALAVGCRWGAEAVRHEFSILPPDAVRAVLEGDAPQNG